MSTFGYALIGLDERGHIIVRDTNYRGPLIVADPKLPDVDGDGYSEHIEWANDSSRFQFGRESVYGYDCVPRLPERLRIVSSAGTPLSEWILAVGSDYAWNELIPLWERAQSMSSRPSSCMFDHEFRVYDLVENDSHDRVRVIHADGQWSVQLEQTVKTCAGLLDQQCSTPARIRTSRSLQHSSEERASAESANGQTVPARDSETRFELNDDSTTAVDLLTTLEWQRIVDESPLSQQGASHSCRSLRLGAKSDWRVPTLEELQSIAGVFGVPGVTNAEQFLGNYEAKFWTSRTFASYGEDRSLRGTVAWMIDFPTGFATAGWQQEENAVVRCVRGTMNEERADRGSGTEGHGRLIIGSSVLVGLAAATAIAKVISRKRFDS